MDKFEPKIGDPVEVWSLGVPKQWNPYTVSAVETHIIKVKDQNDREFSVHRSRVRKPNDNQE